MNNENEEPIGGSEVHIEKMSLTKSIHNLWNRHFALSTGTNFDLAKKEYHKAKIDLIREINQSSLLDISKAFRHFVDLQDKYELFKNCESTNINFGNFLVEFYIYIYDKLDCSDSSQKIFEITEILKPKLQLHCSKFIEVNRNLNYFDYNTIPDEFKYILELFSYTNSSNVLILIEDYLLNTDKILLPSLFQTSLDFLLSKYTYEYYALEQMLRTKFMVAGISKGLNISEFNLIYINCLLKTYD